MIAVILAGGRGTRLAEETDIKPKPLVQIGGRPIIWHIMKIYSHHGVNDFVVCLGYRGYQVKEYFSNLALHNSDVTIDLSAKETTYHGASEVPWRVTLIDTGMSTMTGGRIKRAKQYLSTDEPFCMTYGDGVADVDITAAIAFHRRHGRLATVTSVRPPARFGTMVIENGRVQAFDEKHPNSGLTTNGGFFILEPGVLEYIAGDEISWEGEPLRHLTADQQLAAYEHGGFWQPMDTVWERHLLEELWESGNAPWKVWSDG